MMNYGAGGGMAVGLFVMVALLLLVAVGVWAVARSVGAGSSQPQVPPADLSQEKGHRQARDILLERYARGELSTEEYLDRLHAIGQSAGR